MSTIIERVTDTRWTDRYYGWLLDNGASERTLLAYNNNMTSFMVWFEVENGEEFDPSLITSIDLRAYRKFSLEHEQVKPATWNQRLATMRSVCTWAIEAGILSYDPSSEIKRASQSPLPPRWLDKRDQKRLLRAMERNVNAASRYSYAHRMAIRDNAMIALMLWAGLRVGEVANLEFYDIEISERKGSVIVRMGKGEKYREIPLNSEAREAVRRMLAVLYKFESSGGILFPGKHNSDEKITTRTIERRVKAMGHQARIDVTPHELRHTFAKNLIDSGVPLTVVSRLMGHAKLETTARYIEPGWGDYEAAVEGII